MLTLSHTIYPDILTVNGPCMYVYYCRTYENAMCGGGEREKREDMC